MEMTRSTSNSWSCSQSSDDTLQAASLEQILDMPAAEEKKYYAKHGESLRGIPFTSAVRESLQLVAVTPDELQAFRDALPLLYEKNMSFERVVQLTRGALTQARIREIFDKSDRAKTKHKVLDTHSEQRWHWFKRVALHDLLQDSECPVRYAETGEIEIIPGWKPDICWFYQKDREDCITAIVTIAEHARGTNQEKAKLDQLVRGVNNIFASQPFLQALLAYFIQDELFYIVRFDHGSNYVLRGLQITNYTQDPKKKSRQLKKEQLEENLKIVASFLKTIIVSPKRINIFPSRAKADCDLSSTLLNERINYWLIERIIGESRPVKLKGGEVSEVPYNNQWRFLLKSKNLTVKLRTSPEDDSGEAFKAVLQGHFTVIKHLIREDCAGTLKFVLKVTFTTLHGLTIVIGNREFTIDHEIDVYNLQHEYGVRGSLKPEAMAHGQATNFLLHPAALASAWSLQHFDPALAPEGSSPSHHSVAPALGLDEPHFVPDCASEDIFGLNPPQDAEGEVKRPNEIRFDTPMVVQGLYILMHPCHTIQEMIGLFGIGKSQAVREKRSQIFQRGIKAFQGAQISLMETFYILGIYHADISMGNIVLHVPDAEDDWPLSGKLIDWGVFYKPENLPQVTQTSGTIPSMSLPVLWHRRKKRSFPKRNVCDELEALLYAQLGFFAEYILAEFGIRLIWYEVLHSQDEDWSFKTKSVHMTQERELFESTLKPARAGDFTGVVALFITSIMAIYDALYPAKLQTPCSPGELQCAQYFEKLVAYRNKHCKKIVARCIAAMDLFCKQMSPSEKYNSGLHEMWKIVNAQRDEELLVPEAYRTFWTTFLKRGGLLIADEKSTLLTWNKENETKETYQSLMLKRERQSRKKRRSAGVSVDSPASKKRQRVEI